MLIGFDVLLPLHGMEAGFMGKNIFSAGEGVD
jgi:hypothetical protein